MKQFVCNFAPVRFLPYREIGEFVNVGIVVHCPQTGFFGYRLVPVEDTRRVSDFFPKLDANVLKTGLEGIRRELIRVRANHRAQPVDGELAPEIAQEEVRRFRELIRRREGLLHFGETGTLVADAPEKALDELFGRFVERRFAPERELPQHSVG